ncbi:MAG: HAD family hydrolase [Tabrizicola sp.]|uniref:HAD family hydrolase n=1 Tax=Tabrizicola sp. TaxID=2005166 RepID=UPI0027355EDD|nr:HAD family hydrolase [Tabrizicola sp.]MDP3261382.1 HAD family hydrolase [Tabrizicola sp.]MDP3649171.1 HAD family hydrolase [Paracoccaceae bacterium]MDZ4065854.1 HAD family hydrolase [Tabrizicola sp.]
MSQPIAGLVFDKDGTLFDFRNSWGRWAQGFIAAMAQDGHHADRMGQAIGFDLMTSHFAPDSPVIAGTASEIAGALLPTLPNFNHDTLTGMIDEAAAKATMAEAVPLHPLLRQLRGAGLKLGVATNDSEVPAHAHLAAHGLTDYFDFIAGADSGYGAKPGPGMCLAFAQATGLAPAEVAMIGDSRHDLEAGRAAGMVCIAVLTGLASHADLAPHADVVLPDIGELPGWLKLG